MHVEQRRIQIAVFLHGTDEGSPFATVDAWCFGDFAVHRCFDLPGLWRITMLPVGLSLAPDWCAFEDFDAAVAAMKDMQRCRNEGWGAIRQKDMTKDLESRMKAIALRHGAPPERQTRTATGIRYDIGSVARIDRNRLGRVMTERPNGYGAALDL